MCDTIIANGGVKEPSKKVQNVCDAGAIKHGSDFSCVYDAGHTVQFNELFAMRQKNRNGHPNEGVCAIYDIQFTPMNCFRLGNATGMVQPDQGVYNGVHTVHFNKLFVLSQENIKVSHKQDVCNTRQTSNYIGG